MRGKGQNVRWRGWRFWFSVEALEEGSPTPSSGPTASARGSRLVAGAMAAERNAMPNGDDAVDDGKPEPTWRSTLRAASIFLLVSVSVAIAFYGLK
jgi:hypothetical protein